MTVVYTAYGADGRPNVRIIARHSTCVFQLAYASSHMRGRFGNSVSITPEGALRCVQDWRQTGHRVEQTIGEPVAA